MTKKLHTAQPSIGPNPKTLGIDTPDDYTARVESSYHLTCPTPETAFTPASDLFTGATFFDPFYPLELHRSNRYHRWFLYRRLAFDRHRDLLPHPAR